MALKTSTTHLLFLQICLFWLLYSTFTFIGTEGGGSYIEEWCIADEQTPDEVLQSALDWACGKGGADCSMIQVNKPCFLPNTVRDHASYAFNSYWQKTKNSGGSCFFNSAALVTDMDPSHGSCKYEMVH